MSEGKKPVDIASITQPELKASKLTLAGCPVSFNQSGGSSFELKASKLTLKASELTLKASKLTLAGCAQRNIFDTQMEIMKKYRPMIEPLNTEADIVKHLSSSIMKRVDHEWQSIDNLLNPPELFKSLSEAQSLTKLKKIANPFPQSIGQHALDGLQNIARIENLSQPFTNLIKQANPLQEFFRQRTFEQQQLSEAIRKIVPSWLDDLQVEYKESLNPLCAFEAYKLANKYGFDVPEWVTEYLMQAAVKLLDPEAQGRPTKRALDALGMHTRGQGNVFSRRTKTEQRLAAVTRVRELQEQKGSGYDLDIFLQVGEEFNQSEDTVKNWYYAHRD